MTVLDFKENKSNKRIQGIEKWSNKIVKRVSYCDDDDYNYHYDEEFDTFDIFHFFQDIFKDEFISKSDVEDFLNDLDISPLDIIDITQELDNNYNNERRIDCYFIANEILEELFYNIFEDCTSIQDIKTTTQNYKGD